MIHNIGGTLGLAQRAGKLISGRDVVKESILDGRACLLILAKDAGASLTKEMGHLSHDYDIKVVTIGTKAELGRYLGKRDRSVIAVLDVGFTRIINKNLSNIRDGEATM